jgi:hypothetical protein
MGLKSFCLLFADCFPNSSKSTKKIPLWIFLEKSVLSGSEVGKDCTFLCIYNRGQWTPLWSQFPATAWSASHCSHYVPPCGRQTQMLTAHCAVTLCNCVALHWCSVMPLQKDVATWLRTSLLRNPCSWNLGPYRNIPVYVGDTTSLPSIWLS